MWADNVLREMGLVINNDKKLLSMARECYAKHRKGEYCDHHKLQRKALLEMSKARREIVPFPKYFTAEELFSVVYVEQP